MPKYLYDNVTKEKRKMRTLFKELRISGKNKKSKRYKDAVAALPKAQTSFRGAQKKLKKYNKRKFRK